MTLRDDQQGYDAERKKVFAINPKDARFYHIVADFAVKEHRYKEAIAHHRRLNTILRKMREISEAVLQQSVPGVQKRPRQKHP